MMIIVIIVLLITVLISANSGSSAYNDRKMVETVERLCIRLPMKMALFQLKGSFLTFDRFFDANMLQLIVNKSKLK
jgi:hypothetical protein